MPRLSKKQLAAIQGAEINETDAQYWQALDQFIEEFAMAELFLFHLLIREAGVHQNIGPAIFSGTRTEVAIQYIDRIWQVREPEVKRAAELRGVFQQMRAINDIRNIAIHHRSEKGENGRMVSTARTALTPAKVKEARISSHILGLICIDLYKIQIHLISHAWRLKGDRKSAAIKRSAWRYIPPPNQNQSAKKPSRKDRG